MHTIMKIINAIRCFFLIHCEPKYETNRIYHIQTCSRCGMVISVTGKIGF